MMMANVGRFFLLVAFCWRYCLTASFDQPLNGRNLRIYPLELPPFLIVQRNSSDSIIYMAGVAQSALEWLAESLNFTFEFYQDIVPTMADTPGRRGIIGYLTSQEVDMLLGPVVMTYKRGELMDFAYPIMITQLSLLLPMPEQTVNGVSAVWQPFQPYVWWGLVISIFFIYVFMAIVFKSKPLYFLGILLSQGGHWQRHDFVSRLGTGSWCLACFVLVSAYCSVLISFVTAPVYEPIVSSVHELGRKPKVKPVIENGRTVDALLQSAENGVGNFLINILNKDQNLRCTSPEECLNKVRTGSTVYVQIAEVALDQIGREYMRTGRCDLSLLKERFLYFQASLALAKKSIFTNTITKQLLRIEASGVIGLWWKRATTSPTRCLDESENRPKNPQLKLKGLSGAFVVLIPGIALSVAAFLGEWIAYCRYDQRFLRGC